VPTAITRHLDVLGTFCPLPILLAAREMMRLAAGDRLEVVGDDPAILEDMPVWCERAGHRLVEIAEREGKIISLVEKGGESGKGGKGGTGGKGGISPPERARRGRGGGSAGRGGAGGRAGPGSGRRRPAGR
jgi:tRNA 2-thiouridine synthesizing protein A